MILRKIIEILEANVIINPADLDTDVQWACSADLMSDVLYYCSPNSLLVTGLIKPQVILTSEFVGIKCIVFVQNKKPDKETVELAKEKKIPLLITSLCMYAASGKLFQAGLQGCPKK